MGGRPRFHQRGREALALAEFLGRGRRLRAPSEKLRFFASTLAHPGIGAATPPPDEEDHECDHDRSGVAERDSVAEARSCADREVDAGTP